MHSNHNKQQTAPHKAEARMDICYSTDRNYCPNLAASIASIFMHAQAKQAITIHILHSGSVNEEIQTKLCTLGKLHEGAKFNFITISPEQAAQFSVPNESRPEYSYLTKEMYYRLLLSSLLSELDRALYLDCDIIVQADLTELYHSDISKHCVAAVPDIDTLIFQKRFSLSQYFNSGVLLINLARFREKNIESQLIRCALEHNHYDQDILNIILQGEILYLHPRWNMQYINENRPYSQLSEEEANAFAHPHIIHYISVMKPWKMNCFHPYQKAYFDALKLTEWRQQAWKNFPGNRPLRKALSAVSNFIFSRESKKKIRKILGKIKG